MRILINVLSIVILGFQVNANEETQFHSQARQDEFVYTILYNLLGKQGAGHYLEIGAGEPVYINNTYTLETELEWQGVSIDISDTLSQRWYENRNNLLISKDATKLDYSSILKKFPKVIDYLSLDVDGYYDIVLKKVLLSPHVFKIITIEHDAYRYGDLYRHSEREILTNHGYHLLCADVSQGGLPFEDWWIHPDFFPEHMLEQLTSIDLHGKDNNEVLRCINMLISN